MKSGMMIDAIGNINESMICAADAPVAGETQPGNSSGPLSAGASGKQSGKKAGVIAGIIAAVIIVAGITAGVILGYKSNQRAKEPVTISNTDFPTNYPSGTPKPEETPAPTAEPVINGDARIAALKTLWNEIDDAGATVPMTYKEFLSALSKMDHEGKTILKLCGDPAEIPENTTGKYELECEAFVGRFYRIMSDDGAGIERNVVQFWAKKEINGLSAPCGVQIGDSAETVLNKLGIDSFTENIWEKGMRSFEAEVDGTKIVLQVTCAMVPEYSRDGLTLIILISLEEPLPDDRYIVKNASLVIAADQNTLIDWSVQAALDRNEYRGLPLDVHTPAPTTAPTPGPDDPEDMFSIEFVDNVLHINESSREVSVLFIGYGKSNNNEDNKLIKYFKNALEGKKKNEEDTFHKIKYDVKIEQYQFRLLPYGSDSGYDLYYNLGSTDGELWIVRSDSKICLGSIPFTDEEFNIMLSALNAEAFKSNGEMLLKEDDPVKIRIMDRKDNDKWIYSAEQIARMEQLISELMIISISEEEYAAGFDYNVRIRLFYSDGSVRDLKTDAYNTWVIDSKTVCKTFSNDSCFYFYDSFEGESAPAQ